jgi:hypothetical protein
VIRYALRCEHDHGFEGWFGSSADYDDQSARGLVECPVCGSRQVGKQIMAPAVAGTKRTQTPALPQPARTMVMEAMGKIRQHVKDNFDYVGDAFAKEARAIHEGASEDRGIYGEARPDEVKALREDGIGVAPLPPDPKEIN